jgi:hypothetical protein
MLFGIVAVEADELWQGSLVYTVAKDPACSAVALPLPVDDPPSEDVGGVDRETRRVLRIPSVVEETEFPRLDRKELFEVFSV